MISRDRINQQQMVAQAQRVLQQGAVRGGGMPHLPQKISLILISNYSFGKEDDKVMINKYLEIMRKPLSIKCNSKILWFWS